MGTLEQADVHDAGSKETAPAQRRPRWSRTHTIWLTIALSLLPGVAAALFREHWAAAPAGMRWGAYVASAILILAACSFIVMGEDNRDS
jgi:hypothetical protein